MDETVRIDLLVEMVLWAPRRPRGRRVHADLLEFLRMLLSAAGRAGAAKRTDKELDKLKDALMDIELAQSVFPETLADCQFDVLKRIAVSAGDSVTAALNACQPLFQAPRPAGPGNLIIFPLEVRQQLLEAYQQRDGERASRILDAALAESALRWLAA